MPPLPPLTSKQLQAASLLAHGIGPTEAARQLKLNRTTLYRWRRRADFDALLTERTAKVVADVDEVVARAREGILRLTPDVAAGLADAMKAETYVIDGEGEVHTFAAWGTRLRAYKLILQVSALLVERVEHSGEIRGLSRLSDEELADEIRALARTDKT